ncbi:MAG: hypothetical protein EHM13_06510 [Acidobacteria bacterium]|nr:MAG: hypothetical protein EHM13_06510 [Acidobacteriota bacterium]
MHLVLLATLVVAMASAAPAPPASAPADLLASLKAYEAAANRHDWPAVRPLIAENAVIELGDDLSLVGREHARALHDWERAMATETRYSDCTVSGEAVTCRATEQNDFLRLSGLGPIEYTASTITFEKGQVARMRATLSEHSAEVVTRYMQPFLEWANTVEPKGVETFLKPDGSFAFGFDSAMAFKRLLRLYALTRGGGVRAL